MSVPRNDIQELDLSVGASIAADFVTIEHDVRFFDMGSCQFIWSGANATTAQIIPQASLDKVNWCNLASGTTIKKVDAASGCQLYTFPTIEFTWFRVKFVANTNSAGVATVKTCMKRRRSPSV